jgi:4-hydroxy-2-oxoglutarate aldolase
MEKRLAGIFAPICTPFERGEVSLQRVRANMQRYRATGLAGVFALGSNGESKSLTETEKLQILEAVLQEKAPHQLVMAGTGYESTAQTIAFSRKVASAGADFVSVVTPSYFKKTLTDEAMIRYYTDVADAVTVPVLIYNAPGFTGMDLSPKVIARISRHPNIRGMKDTSPGNMTRYLDVCGESFSVLSGTINTLFTALTLGATGGVVSLANAFPAPCCELYEKYSKGDVDGARRLHYRLYRLSNAVSGSFGVAGVKFSMELGGYYGGDPRLPLLPISEEGKTSIRVAVAAAGVAE